MSTPGCRRALERRSQAYSKAMNRGHPYHDTKLYNGTRCGVTSDQDVYARTTVPNHLCDSAHLQYIPLHHGGHLNGYSLITSAQPSLESAHCTELMGRGEPDREKRRCQEDGQSGNPPTPNPTQTLPTAPECNTPNPSTTLHTSPTHIPTHPYTPHILLYCQQPPTPSNKHIHLCAHIPTHLGIPYGPNSPPHTPTTLHPSPQSNTPHAHSPTHTQPHSPADTQPYAPPTTHTSLHPANTPTTPAPKTLHSLTHSHTPLHACTPHPPTLHARTHLPPRDDQPVPAAPALVQLQPPRAASSSGSGRGQRGGRPMGRLVICKCRKGFWEAFGRTI